jgi:hypothetical protein
LSALIAVSCAAEAFSRASNALAIAPVTSGFSRRSWASLPRASSPDRVSRSRRFSLPVSSSIAAPFYRVPLDGRNVAQSPPVPDSGPQAEVEVRRRPAARIDSPCRRVPSRAESRRPFIRCTDCTRHNHPVRCDGSASAG